MARRLLAPPGGWHVVVALSLRPGLSYNIRMQKQEEEEEKEKGKENPPSAIHALNTWLHRGGKTGVLFLFCCFLKSEKG